MQLIIHTDAARRIGKKSLLLFFMVSRILPNGWRYPLVGGTRPRHFDGTHSKPRKLPENAQTPTSRVHAVLGRCDLCKTR